MEASSNIHIAVVEGYCVAGGLEVLLACDFPIASASAKIGDGHVNFGQLPGAGGSQRLPRAIAPMHARYLMLTGELLDASDAAHRTACPGDPGCRPPILCRATGCSAHRGEPARI